jgi:hypothetical protein
MKILSIVLLLLAWVPGLAQENSKPESTNTAQASAQFSEFKVKVEVEKGEFEVRGILTLAPESDGMNLYKEEVEIKAGSLTVTLPAGSFKQDGERTKIRYQGRAGDFDLDVLFRIIGRTSFHLKIEGEGADIGKIAPEDVTLRIGNDAGKATALTP